MCPRAPRHPRATAALTRRRPGPFRRFRSDLGSNFLSGDLPSSLGNAAALRELRLDDNLLTGALPPSLAALSGLQTLCVPGAAARG